MPSPLLLLLLCSRSTPLHSGSIAARCNGAPAHARRRRICRPRTGGEWLPRPGAGAGDQLRAGRGQPAAAAGGPGAPPRAERHEGEALRRGRARAPRLRGLRGRLHRGRARPPGPAPGRGPVRFRRVGARQPPAPHSRHVHHRRDRGQRGAVGHRRCHAPVAAPGHGVPPRCAGGVQPHLPRVRHHGALPRRAVLLVPALVRGVPTRGAALHVPAAGVPGTHRRAVPRERVPVLRVQGGPGAGGPGLRAVRAQRRRRSGRRHGAALRQHAPRAGGRRARRHLQGQLRQGAGDPGVGDRVAVAGRRRRGRRHAAERRQVQRQPHAPRRAGEGHPGGSRRAAAGLRVRALQRGPEARPGVRATLWAVQARRHPGLRRRCQGAHHHGAQGDRDRQREREREWHRRLGGGARARRRRRRRAGHRILHRVCRSSEQGEEQAAAVRGKLGGSRRPGHGVRTLLVWERTDDERHYRDWKLNSAEAYYMPSNSIDSSLFLGLIRMYAL